MRRWFLSDLHLDASSTATTRRFLELLERFAPGDAAYLLGDLFEAWIGDDDDAPFAREIVAALAATAARGVFLNFQHGNRDFLVGERFAAEAGLTLLPEEHLVDVAGVPTLLMHGDTLCTSDTAYVAFRAQVRDPVWQRGFLAQPLAARRAFAAQARAASAAHGARMDASIADVDPAAVRTALARHGVARMIHGHTHRAARHAFKLDDGHGERHVLGDWHGAAVVFVAHAGALEAILI